MKSSLTKKIIFDYFDSNHTSIQRKMIEEWLADKENHELFHQYLDEWESLHPQYTFDAEKGFDKINLNIQNVTEISELSEIKVKQINFNKIFKWSAAASIILTFAWFGWSKFSTPSVISYENLVQITKDETGEIYEKENLMTIPMLITLPDESSVILQPQSKISYSPKEFNKLKREVILSGEAFFEVHKNAEIPFLVYANELITKVLGTSFTIKASPKSAESEVIVKTGKVAVFMQNDVHKNEKINGKFLEGLVLSANEKVKINRNEFKIDKPILVKQEQLELPIQKLSFDFDDTPATEVLEILKNAYHVQIIYDHAKLANCRLTAHLSDEPLLEKIKLICIALDATFEEIDEQIIIKSNGCK
jgi:transmembrane sensor